jgi:hypothetical protein
VTATDDRDPNPVVVVLPPSGSLFPLGTTVVNCKATDSEGNETFGAFTVTVRDTKAPGLNCLSASPSELWPPNNKMVKVLITADMADVCDAAPFYRIIGVTVTDVPKPKGTLKVVPENDVPYQIMGDHVVLLRAKRLGNSAGRIYTITVEIMDGSGNRTTGTVTVTVPHARSK